MWDELARCASGGLVATLFGSGPSGIGLPPILMYGSPYLNGKIVRDVVTGDKTLCLCVTEPSGGSDVAATRTTAHKEGEYYVLNGSKKWITGGMKAEYLTVVCRYELIVALSHSHATHTQSITLSRYSLCSHSHAAGLTRRRKVVPVCQ